MTFSLSSFVAFLSLRPTCDLWLVSSGRLAEASGGGGCAVSAYPKEDFFFTQILKMECAVSERMCSLSVEVVRHEPGNHFPGAEAVIPTVSSQE